MGWEHSHRRSQLPTNWPALRRQALERDGHRCRWITNGQRCDQPATEVDHRTDPHDHSLANLQSLCAWHHQRKTQREAAAARARRPSDRRPPEPHPGIVD